MHRFRNPDGTERQFGASAHLRTRKTDFGKAHDIWVAPNGKCFHSPGPGDYFREDDLESALKGAKWLFVISYATTYGAFQEQFKRAESIVGLPWSLPSANCQHTVSWVTTGKAESFQWGALLGLGLVVGLPVAVAALNQPPKRRRRRTRR